MTVFDKEKRYIVLKMSDMDKLSDNTKRVLGDALLLVVKEQAQADMPKRECVVVESDWIEYPVVWNMIKARMEKESTVNKSAEVVGWLTNDKGDLVPDPNIYNEWAMKHGTPILPDKVNDTCWYWHTGTASWWPVNEHSSKLSDKYRNTWAWLQPTPVSKYRLAMNTLEPQPSARNIAKRST